MALVIAHAELVSDQTSDPRTAPQRRREAVRLGAFQQQRLEAFELRGVQQRLTAGAAGLAQPGFAVTPVSSQPLADALPRDLQSPRCLGLTTALLDQPDRFETALLQGLEIPPYAFCISHTYKDVRTPKRCHFILRDSIIPLNAYAGDVDSELIAAAVQGDSDTVSALLAEGADVNGADRYGWTPLLLAALAGRADVARTLLANGANVNAKGKGDDTALIWAATLGHTHIVRILAAEGSDLDARDREGRSALMWAERNDHRSTLQTLLTKGADVNAEDKSGRTALTLAAEKGHTECVEALLAKGANIDARDRNRWTPLMLAAKNGHTACVRSLLANGADVNAENTAGQSSLMLVTEAHTTIARLLKEAGARE